MALQFGACALVAYASKFRRRYLGFLLEPVAIQMALSIAWPRRGHPSLGRKRCSLSQGPSSCAGSRPVPFAASRPRTGQVSEAFVSHPPPNPAFLVAGRFLLAVSLTRSLEGGGEGCGRGQCFSVAFRRFGLGPEPAVIPSTLGKVGRAPGAREKAGGHGAAPNHSPCEVHWANWENPGE